MRSVGAENLHAIILLALIVGLGFSIWSAWETTHPQGSSVCDVNSLVSCGRVALSGDTSLYGIPFWSVGVGGFVAMLAVDVPLYMTWRRDLLLALTVLSVLGAVATLYFIYQEVAVIGSICLICTGAHLCNFAVLGSASYLLVTSGRADDEEDPAPTPPPPVPAKGKGNGRGRR
jgi:uncharacterized membrane protein